MESPTLIGADATRTSITRDHSGGRAVDGRVSGAARRFRIVDLEGNQAVDTLFFNADEQRRALQRAGHHPRAGPPLSHHRHAAALERRQRDADASTADTCGRHDTLGGACSAESNTVRYALEKRHMHSCRDNFLLALARAPSIGHDASATCQQHQFLHERAGDAGRRADVRRRHLGRRPLRRDARASMDVIVLISNCPQLNNPCNAYNPTPDSCDDTGRLPGRAHESARPAAGRPVGALDQRRDDPAPRRSARMFDKVLIANRGAIACRILRTVQGDGHWLRRRVLGGRRALAARVRTPTRRTALGPPPAAESYLRQERILEAARECGAEAIHPGYGFLSENAAFAAVLRGRRHRLHRADARADARLRPQAHGARAGAAARSAAAAGQRICWPIVQARVAAASRIGYPVMLKSTAGGGGIGMQPLQRGARARGELSPPCSAWPKSNFSDGGVFLEKYVERARHIEVQIFGDGAGRVIALGERDCSVQRRNQKVIEESPAPGSRATRAPRAARGGGAPGPQPSAIVRPARSSSSTTRTPRASTSSK